MDADTPTVPDLDLDSELTKAATKMAVDAWDEMSTDLQLRITFDWLVERFRKILLARSKEKRS
jgi:hypothetical protein